MHEVVVHPLSPLSLFSVGDGGLVTYRHRHTPTDLSSPTLLGGFSSPYMTKYLLLCSVVFSPFVLVTFTRG